MEPQGLQNPMATFEKMRNLLKAKDDTSRFVGLALLKTVLDNGQLVDDPECVRTLWESLSPKFLDRLLRAKQNDKVKKADTKDMVSLAVAVLHTFAILLPEESRKQKRLTGRIAPLIMALIESPSETTTLILQTLLTISSQPEGALELLSIEDLSPLIEIANQNSLILEIFQYTWLNASTLSTYILAVRESIDKVIPALSVAFNGTDAVTLLEFLAKLFPKMEPEALPQTSKWLLSIISMLRKLVSSKPTSAGRAAYTQLAAALLQTYSTTCPILLFKDDQSVNSDSKPFSYLFINLLLIDLRASFPSLLGKLNSAEYPAISQRLAAAFDILSSFIGFLVRSLDDEVNTTGFGMPPDLLLRLRKDIAETMSLTLEYFRDRWDASTAGASGLHSDARVGTATTSEGTRLTLTWESMDNNVNSDPLILAGTRALAIWIREDDNENLRKETAGLMDMWIELYKSHSSSHGNVDFRYPILLALEGVIETEHGIETFLSQNGWEAVSSDLQSITKSVSDSNPLGSPTMLNDALRGEQAIRVLLTVLESQYRSSLQESWMHIIPATAAMKISSTASPAPLLEFQIAMLQLSMALLSHSAGRMTKRYLTSHAALSGIAEQLRALVGKSDDEVQKRQLRCDLDDLDLELGNLRI